MSESYTKQTGGYHETGSDIDLSDVQYRRTPDAGPQAASAETQRLREVVVKMAEALKAYEITYMRTQSHPTPAQESVVMGKVTEALALAQPYIDLAGEK